MSGDILVLGAGGQLGRALRAGGDRQDIRDPDGLAALFERVRARVVINAAAMTDLDAAEGDPARAFAVNAEGAGNVARAAARHAAALIHVSSECVFDGRTDRPYVEDDPTAPISVYGASKRAGEAQVLSAAPDAIVLRTAWVLGSGPRNFLRVIATRAREGRPLSVVTTEVGTPTGVQDLARAILTLAARVQAGSDAPRGLYHFAGAGRATRHRLAQEIVAVQARLLGIAPVEVHAVDSHPGAIARRPPFAALDSGRIGRDHGVVPRGWRAMVTDEVEALLRAEGRIA